MREQDRYGTRRVWVNLHWYDRDGAHLGVSQRTDARFIDLDELGRHPVFPGAAYVSVQLVTEPRS